VTTSSAKPAKLLALRDGGLPQVEAWEGEVPKLSTALDELRTALASADLPDELSVSVLFYDTWFDTLARNQRHLDEWVGDVANEFIRAGGGDPDQLRADQTFTVDDADIQVGFASRAASEEQAREDAEALDAILGEHGMVHPYDLSNDPDKLEEMAALYPELRDILARAQRFATDEDYAAALVNELGPQNVRTMADLTNTFGLANDLGRADIEEGAYDGYVVPLAVILGNADRSGRMDPAVREALLDMDATDEPPANIGSADDYADRLAEMRYRTLALLLTEGDFSPRTTAEMANDIIRHGPVGVGMHDASGFVHRDTLDEHRVLASNQWAALAALERDDAAANIFYRTDADEFPGELENLYLMNGDVGVREAAERLGVSEDDIRGEINQTIADTMTGGILEHPLATGTTYSPETLTLVEHMVDAAGSEYVDAPDEIRQALAQISTPYTIDLAIAAEGGHEDLPDGRLANLSEEQIDRFFQEVSESESARVALGQNAAALVTDQIGIDAADIAAGDANAFGQGNALATAYYRELGEAWDQVQIDWVEQREALVAGWRSFTDPVVDLVSGKIVERIPVVSTAADLPLASNVVDGITGQIKDGINSAIYDNLIPAPEVEAMTTWRDAIEPEVLDAVAAGLYQDEGVRSSFVEEARTAEPGLYDRITADGEVTLEEFRELRGVSNAVLTQAGRIVDGFESEMAFNKVFGG
jgi:hypothetical protein